MGKKCSVIFVSIEIYKCEVTKNRCLCLVCLISGDSLWPRPKQNIVYTKQDKIFFKAGGELLNTAQAS